MSLKRLDVTNIRNIEKASLNLAPTINVIVGENGSGKTSLLESAYFLGSARTFRSTNADPLIRRGADVCRVSGVCEGAREIAVSRDRSGTKKLSLSGNTIQRTSELAATLPILVLEPQTVNLLIGGPEYRRRFLNWGVFHVEPSFRSIWEDATRCLQQRNQLLKHSHAGDAELEVWSKELARLSELIHQFRTRYMKEYCGRFARNSELTGISEVMLRYEPGWNTESALEEVLRNELQNDLKRGFTNKGFHRADVKILVAGDDAAKTCSRGELKMLSWMLVITQGEDLDDNLVYLLDDLFSELDSGHRARICEYFADREKQVLTTGIDSRALLECWGDRCKAMFHVKHGVVTGEI
ncbi:MAG TPA: DNA replication/repair protein RecF [Gammaproteobacteria bacterium]|nr:DNA replication/repair protein RecF [Gammaproteobacteria bacterium]